MQYADGLPGYVKVLVVFAWQCGLLSVPIHCDVDGEYTSPPAVFSSFAD